MFSSQINSRDLFFSNPVDHFLGNHGDFRTSGESGFSSTSQSQKRNSREHQSTNSQDLFSQSQKTYLETPQGDSDYRKYISQNLLFGKGKRETRNYSFRNAEKDESEPCTQKSPVRNNGVSNEIRGLIESLNDNMKKLNASVTDVKDTIKEIKLEINEQNEKISSLDEAYNKHLNSIENLENHGRKNNKKEEDNFMKFQKLVTKNTNEVMESLEKLEGSLNKDKSKLLESVKKISTTQANGNKKILEETRRLDTKLNKNFSEMKYFIETTEKHREESIDSKLREIKTLLNSLKSSIQDIISEKLNDIKKSDEPTFTKPLFVTKPANQRRLRSNAQKESATFYQKPDSSLQSSVHTPLAEYAAQRQNSNSFKHLNKENIKDISTQKQQLQKNSSLFNIKRRITPDLNSPFSPGAKRKTGFTGVMKTTINTSQFYRNKNLMNEQSYMGNQFKRQNYDTRSCTQQSSPYMTVVQAATVAEEFFL